MARPKAAPDAILSRRVLVNVKRDQTTSTPRVVWAHEIPILEGIFGEGNAPVVDVKTLDEGYSAKPTPDLLVHNKTQDVTRRPSESLGIGWVFIDDPRAEYDRLAECYGMHPEVKQPWVENVYGRFQAGTFAQVIGKPTLEDFPADQLRALLFAYGYKLPEAGYESTEAERKAASTAAAEFAKLPAEKLHELAEQYGVEVG